MDIPSRRDSTAHAVERGVPSSPHMELHHRSRRGITTHNASPHMGVTTAHGGNRLTQCVPSHGGASLHTGTTQVTQWREESPHMELRHRSRRGIPSYNVSPHSRGHPLTGGSTAHGGGAITSHNVSPHTGASHLGESPHTLCPSHRETSPRRAGGATTPRNHLDNGRLAGTPPTGPPPTGAARRAHGASPSLCGFTRSSIWHRQSSKGRASMAMLSSRRHCSS